MSRRIVWKGFFNGSTGYINASRRYAQLTYEIWKDTVIAPYREIGKDDPIHKLVINDVRKDDLHILHQIPTVSPNEEAYFTVTEFNIPPHEWWISLNKAKLIITQSKFCRDSFARIDGVDKSNIKIVNYPLPDIVKEGPSSREKYINYANQRLGFNNPFIFGSVFEWVCRKKPELMWEAFTQEFDKNEEVLLINKISIPQGFRDWKLIYNKYCKDDPRIIIDQEYYNDLSIFYRGIDSYISCTAGEGWGATLSEAMAFGLPTIGSKHSGNLDFMNKSNSFLVDVGPWEFIGNDKTNHLWMVHDYQMWKLPKVSEIRKAMRTVYEGKYNKSILQNAEKIKLQLSPDNIMRQLSSAFVGYI